jgi:hypothetical protein
VVVDQRECFPQGHDETNQTKQGRQKKKNPKEKKTPKNQKEKNKEKKTPKNQKKEEKRCVAAARNDARKLPHQQQQPDHKPGMRVEGRGIESVMIYMNCYSY